MLPSTNKGDESTMYDTVFMHQMLHQLRNPLTFLYSSLQILEKDMPEVKDYRYWAEANDDMHYLLDILNQITYFINASSENFKECMISDMIETCIEHADIPVPVFYKNLTENATVQGNRKYLQIALLSLLKNAYESGAQSIHVSLNHADTNYVITIEDNGKGMGEDTKSHIFEPFYSEKEQHSGLGLSLSQSVIHNHKGKITCQSELGEGTTIQILLPMQ